MSDKRFFCVFVCVYVCGVHMYVYKGQKTICESFLSFKHVGYGDVAQVNTFGASF